MTHDAYLMLFSLKRPNRLQSSWMTDILCVWPRWSVGQVGTPTINEIYWFLVDLSQKTMCRMLILSLSCTNHPSKMTPSSGTSEAQATKVWSTITTHGSQSVLMALTVSGTANCRYMVHGLLVHRRFTGSRWFVVSTQSTQTRHSFIPATLQATKIALTHKVTIGMMT